MDSFFIVHKKNAVDGTSVPKIHWTFVPKTYWISILKTHPVSKSDFASDFAPLSEGLLWSTCLRSLVLGFGECVDHKDDFQIYHGREAYLFCLEVVCGLRSPMIGETEVFGQFKNLIKNHSFEHTYKSQKLKIILEDICRDAKQVRQKHLLNLGSQSYGGVVSSTY